jgi:hypothetical protein
VTFFPLIHVLFWIAMATAPHGTSQILIESPPEFGAWTWTMQEYGWTQSVDQSWWTVDGGVVTAKGKNVDKQDVSQFVKGIKGIKGHDWSASASLDLGQASSLAKVGDTFIYTRHKGSPAEEHFVIKFKTK